MSKHGNFDFSKVTIYLVGGFVRDHFIKTVYPAHKHLEVKDKDYVVVGSNPEEMGSLGFKQVGADFPVFLHPDTGEEYTLARTERKSGEGYTGFDCEWKGVTIEEDLSRRDLTINSIAWDCTRNLGQVVDPFGGVSDIKKGILQNTSDAFEEDPVRILRVGRFMSRYPEFSPSLDLQYKCVDMVAEGALQHLTPERVWKEIEKVMRESSKPSMFFDFLWTIGADGLVLPDVMVKMLRTEEQNDHHPEPNVFNHTMQVIDHAAHTWGDPEITFACLTHDFGKPFCYNEYGVGHGHDKEGFRFIEDWCDKLKTSKSYKQLALMTCLYHQKVHSILGRGSNSMCRPKSIMKMFEETSALSKPERFKKMLKACESDSNGRGLLSSMTDNPKHTREYFRSKDYPQRIYLEECLDVVLSVDTKAISGKMLKEGKEGKLIGEAIRVARINAIRSVQNNWRYKGE